MWGFYNEVWRSYPTVEAELCPASPAYQPLVVGHCATYGCMGLRWVVIQFVYPTGMYRVADVAVLPTGCREDSPKPWRAGIWVDTT